MPNKKNINFKLDWREQGQEKYLKGLKFTKQIYTKYSDNWEHDHCEFCNIKFSEEQDKSSDSINIGYTTKDKYRWICEECFNFFQKKYNLIEV